MWRHQKGIRRIGDLGDDVSDLFGGGDDTTDDTTDERR